MSGIYNQLMKAINKRNFKKDRIGKSFFKDDYAEINLCNSNIDDDKLKRLLNAINNYPELRENLRVLDLSKNKILDDQEQYNKDLLNMRSMLKSAEIAIGNISADTEKNDFQKQELQLFNYWLQEVFQMLNNYEQKLLGKKVNYKQPQDKELTVSLLNSMLTEAKRIFDKQTQTEAKRSFNK